MRCGMSGKTVIHLPQIIVILFKHIKRGIRLVGESSNFILSVNALVITCLLILPKSTATEKRISNIEFTSEPVKILVDGKIYKLGYTSDIDPVTLKEKMWGKRIVALDRYGRVVEDRDILEKIFFVQFIYRKDLSDINNVPAGPDQIQGYRSLEDFRFMHQLTETVLFIREAGTRALVQVGEVYLTGGASIGSKLTKKGIIILGKEVAKNTAISMAKTVLTNPTSYLKGSVSLVFEKAVSEWKSAERLFLRTMDNTLLRYDDAKRIHESLCFGKSRGEVSKNFLARLTLQAGGGTDLLSQLQKVGDYAVNEALSEISGLYDSAGNLVKMGMIGYSIKEFLIKKVPLYKVYLEQVEYLHRVESDYKNSYYWRNVIAKYIDENIRYAKIIGKGGKVEESRDKKKEYRKFKKSIGGIEFVYIRGDSFMMGSNSGEKDEGPRHRVEVDGFWIGKYEITQRQYQSIMGRNPSRFKGNNRPVEWVSWHDAIEFCRRFSSRYGVRARLPYEAEWEYACRAGTTTVYYWGNKIHGDYCWYYNNSGGRTHPVGQKLPNKWGLYDMSGNVYEWCMDWYDENYYKNSPVNNPKGPDYEGPDYGKYPVFRGGSWKHSADTLRSGLRCSLAPRYWPYYSIGFRVVVSAEE
jgi:formylglycine-generating enzyme required for sulfatase activity